MNDTDTCTDPDTDGEKTAAATQQKEEVVQELIVGISQAFENEWINEGEKRRLIELLFEPEGEFRNIGIVAKSLQALKAQHEEELELEEIEEQKVEEEAEERQQEEAEEEIVQEFEGEILEDLVMDDENIVEVSASNSTLVQEDKEKENAGWAGVLVGAGVALGGVAAIVAAKKKKEISSISVSRLNDARLRSMILNNSNSNSNSNSNITPPSTTQRNEILTSNIDQLKDDDDDADFVSL